MNPLYPQQSEEVGMTIVPILFSRELGIEGHITAKSPGWVSEKQGPACLSWNVHPQALVWQSWNVAFV